MAVNVTRTATTLTVESPYNARFVEGAKRLSGRFEGDARAWAFDIRDEERVLDLCRNIYGSDGLTTDVVSVKVSFPEGKEVTRGPISLHGFTIAKAADRDSGAKAVPGVVLLAGGFRSGGSRQYWATQARPGTVVLLRDFPRTAAIGYVADPPTKIVVEIIEEAPPVDPDALKAERERLAARIVEIDTLLARTVGTAITEAEEKVDA